MAGKSSYRATRKKTKTGRTSRLARYSAARKSNKKNYYVQKYKSVRRSALPQFTLAQFKPFSLKAKGVRIPDRNTAESMPFSAVDTGFLTTDSGATANPVGFVISPNPNIYRAFVAGGSTVGSTTSTMAIQGSWGSTVSAASSKNTALASQFQVIRVAAHGVRLSSTVQPFYAQGTVHWCYVTLDLTEATWPVPTTVADMMELPGYGCATVSSLTTHPVVIRNKFMDESAWQYRDPADTYAQRTSAPKGFGGDTFGWYGIYIVLENVYNTNTPNNQVRLENVIHFECQIKPAQGLSGATPSPTSSAVLDATSNSTAGMPSTDRGNPESPPTGAGTPSTSLPSVPRPTSKVHRRPIPTHGLAMSGGMADHVLRRPLPTSPFDPADASDLIAARPLHPPPLQSQAEAGGSSLMSTFLPWAVGTGLTAAVPWALQWYDRRMWRQYHAERAQRYGGNPMDTYTQAMEEGRAGY